MRQVSTLLGALVLTCVTLVSVSHDSEAQSNDKASPGPAAQEEDARAYAADYGVSEREADRRLDLQVEIGELDRELMAKEGDTFAGLWIQNEPRYKVIARFTKRGKKTIKPYVSGGPLEKLVQVRPADATLNDLEAAQDEATAMAERLDVPSQSGIDVISNRAYVNVESKERFNSAMQRKKADLPEQAAVDEVDELLEPSAGMYGGLNLRVPNGVDCTTGFSVINTRSRATGTTTAAHCSDYVYRGSRRLPVVTGSLTGPYDFQWHTTPYLRDRPLVRDNYRFRPISRARGRFFLPIGARVCHYGAGGKIPEYRCGIIRDRSFGGLSGVNRPTNTYIKVTNYQNDIEDLGDSGGPWYRGQTALGIHVAGDRKNVAAYMSVTYLNNAGPRDFNLVVRRRP